MGYKSTAYHPMGVLPKKNHFQAFVFPVPPVYPVVKLKFPFDDSSSMVKRAGNDKFMTMIDMILVLIWCMV